MANLKFFEIHFIQCQYLWWSG